MNFDLLKPFSSISYLSCFLFVCGAREDWIGDPELAEARALSGEGVISLDNPRVSASFVSIPSSVGKIKKNQ